MKTTNIVEEKEDQFGRQLFEALKSTNLDKWRALSPSFEQYRALMELALEAGMANLTRQKADSFQLVFKRDADSAYRNDGMQLLNEGRSLGIQWKDATFNKFDWVASYPDDFPSKYLNGDIYFYHGENTFLIEGVEAIEYDNRYKLQSVKKITKLR